MIGRSLAHYDILEAIGSGGMGEVYRARDTKVDREVALKLLPPQLADNEERRERFAREAKALAAMNHPGIVQVYSVEQVDDLRFITMELVRGKTLEEELFGSRLALCRFFDVAIPLAEALASAHEAGIVHRDLKPANVMLTHDGVVKVLDFGLARSDENARDHAGSESPTVAKTRDGVVAGTFPYMSPEQAEGKSVDARSDLFSMGAVLYEMLTGARAFDGDSPAAVVSAILRDEPKPLSELRPDGPAGLVRKFERCLKAETGTSGRCWPTVVSR